MTIIKILLAGLIVVPLIVSMAVAADDIDKVKDAKTITQKPILTINTMPDSKQPRSKRVFDRAEITQSASMNPAALQHLHIHNEIRSAECYTLFGNPPVMRSIGFSIPIDCNYWGDGIESE